MIRDKYNRAKEIENEVDCLNTIERSLNNILIGLSKEHGEKLKEIVINFCQEIRDELEQEFNNL